VSLGVAVVADVPGGGSKRKRARRRDEQPQHYLAPERAQIYARAGTELAPQAKPGEADVSITEPVSPRVELALARMQRSEREAAEAIAAERAVLAFLEAQEAREQAAMRSRKLEQEALLAYLMVA
jgi:hypothetical protein